jgi:hypothetical protein
MQNFFSVTLSWHNHLRNVLSAFFDMGLLVANVIYIRKDLRNGPARNICETQEVEIFERARLKRLCAPQ